MQKMVKENNLLKRLVFLGLLTVMSSCLIPTTKDNYILKFEKFVDQVEKDHENYSQKDWKWADTQFEKYSEDWYIEYKPELSPEEKLKVNMMVMRYRAIKGGDELGDRLEDLIREDAREMKDKINEYLENDAEEDLEKIRDGLQEIGDSAVKVFEDVISSLGNRK